MLEFARRASPFLVSFTVTSVFFINFCSWIFQCGCHSLWAGADLMCNIHAQQGHHCPWCSHGHAGHALIMTLLCAPQLVVALLSRGNWVMRAALATAVFPAAGVLVALAFGWHDGYWPQ